MIKINKRNTNGFFLVEVSVTLLIVATTLFVIMSALSHSLKGVNRIRQLEAAEFISKTKMFEVIQELRETPDSNEKTGSTKYERHMYQWKADFNPIENTEDQLLSIHFKVFENEKTIFETFTILSK
ncbi:MAG: hypothetical protein KAI43_05460 [Candidatus Aureabacteria bacterium]|nr:hypothetical protein [Candidatus Auribacterota bacterium]